jgi:hypothetical protein
MQNLSVSNKIVTAESIFRCLLVSSCEKSHVGNNPKLNYCREKKELNFN